MDKFWYEDPSVLFERTLLIDFFPATNMSLNQRLNACVRLAMYTSIILCIYTNEPKYISILFFALIVTYLIFDNKKETMDNLDPSKLAKCTEPIEGNPYMNFTMGDYLNLDKDGLVILKEKNCDVNDPQIKEKQSALANENLFQDVNDLMGTKYADRQFYTMPNTEIVNRQDTFAKWCYLTPLTCKEEPGNCNPYEDIRLGKSVQFLESKL